MRTPGTHPGGTRPDVVVSDEIVVVSARSVVSVRVFPKVILVLRQSGSCV